MSRVYTSYIVTPFLPQKSPTVDLQANNEPIIEAVEAEQWSRGELEKLLDCIWEKESSRGKNMIGDGGLAIGHYQIHIDIHPVTYDCAMDFECSREYTRSMISVGKGYLWTGYRKCI